MFKECVIAIAVFGLGVAAPASATSAPGHAPAPASTTSQPATQLDGVHVHATPELPVKAFVRSPPITQPSISPDGKYLAVSVHEKDGRYQLAVLKLPGLKPASRLNMAPHTVPAGIHWVSKTRLVMSVGRQTGSLNQPQGTGDIVAVNYDGSQKRILYSLRHRNPRKNPNILSMVKGAPQIAGFPNKPNGHLFISVSPFPKHKSYGKRDQGRSLLYEVDARNGSAIKVAEIHRLGMSFVLHDGVARYAIGSKQSDPFHEIVYYRKSGDAAWKPMQDKYGKGFRPVEITPDGKKVYGYLSHDGGPDKLVLANLDGSNPKILAGNDFASISGTEWTPHPNKPYAVVFNTRRPRIAYIGNSIYARILKTLSKQYPKQLITIAGKTHDGKTLLVHARSDRNPGLYALLDRDTMHLRPLFQLEPWIKPAQMAARQPIEFTSSADQTLAGFLTVPNGSNGKDLPMILIPHGGPIGPADHWGFDTWAQFLANRGYAVLQINYRGSGGRGNAFMHAGYRQFGTGIQQDLIDGVHWAIKQGIADPKRICIFGGSFGGYSALMAPIRAPKLFQCSVDYAGISDYMIEFNRSDTSERAAGRNYFTRAIGTDKKTVRAISPIYHLDRFNIPVLIVHGKDDPRVPYKNATELRSALEKADKPYEWLVRGKELHGFYSEKNNKALLETMSRFFRKHIGPGAERAN